jgi:hypothetical protein
MKFRVTYLIEEGASISNFIRSHWYSLDSIKIKEFKNLIERIVNLMRGGPI